MLRETAPWLVPVQVADLLPKGTLAALASWRGPVFVDIGASDRNTMDVELLPVVPDAFLITAEPLVDKWARGIGRRKGANKVEDRYNFCRVTMQEASFCPSRCRPRPSLMANCARSTSVA